jgi:hypothetical protein
MTEHPTTKWPIWVTLLFALLILDVTFRVLDEVYRRLYPETSVLDESISGWAIANLVLLIIALTAGIAIYLRRPIGLKLGVIALIGWIVELVVGTWVDEFETSLEMGIIIGFDIAIGILFGLLIERLIRSRAVHEFFGTLDPELPIQLTEPPPPPTFAE